MIKTENIVINDTTFKRTYSDEDYYIQKVGTNEIYSEAVDILDKNYEYVETDEKFEKEEQKIEDNNTTIIYLAKSLTQDDFEEKDKMVESEVEEQNMMAIGKI